MPSLSSALTIGRLVFRRATSLRLPPARGPESRTRPSNHKSDRRRLVGIPLCRSRPSLAWYYCPVAKGAELVPAPKPVVEALLVEDVVAAEPPNLRRVLKLLETDHTAQDISIAAVWACGGRTRGCS